MVRLSNQIRKKKSLLFEIGVRMPALQAITESFDAAAAELLGVNETDLRALDFLVRTGPKTAGELAELLGLTRGATTTAIDRLERAGLARRLRDPKDRRVVRIDITRDAQRRGAEIWGPLATEGMHVLDRWGAKDLEVVVRFLKAAQALQEGHLARIRAEVERRRRKPG